MQLTSFISHLNNPNSISNESEIKSIVDEFPYCQTGHLMYAYQLKKDGNILFEEQLKKAATYCTDRRRLFEQLHQEALKEQTIVEEETIVTTEEKEISETLTIAEVATEPAITETEKTPEEPIIPENIPAESAASEEVKKPLDELEKNYLGAAISSSIFLETNTVEEDANIEETPINEESVEVSNSFDPSSTHTFSDWLKHFNNEKVSETTVVEEKKASPKFDLINKFIQEDPKIEPKKTSFYSPVNMARLSVVDDSELVSETLALIHVEQGSFQEAINAYEKLSLKNPEKRSYFANQIKILKQKIK